MMQEVLDGGLDLLRAPLALAALLAAAMLARLSLPRWIFAALAAVGVVSVPLVPPVAWAGIAAAAAVALLGILVVLHWPAPKAVACAAAIASGAAAGWAAEFPWATWLELAGGALATFAVAACAAWGAGIAQRYRNAELGMRIAGAWVTALAVLLLLLGLRG